jgi:hypothetical protein
MKHFLYENNLGLITCRQTAVNSWEHCSITNLIVDDSRVSNRTKERGYVFPLYLYPSNNNQLSTESKAIRSPNLDKEIVQKIATSINLQFLPDENLKEGSTNTFTPIDIISTLYCTAPLTGKNTKNF